MLELLRVQLLHRLSVKTSLIPNILHVFFQQVIRCVNRKSVEIGLQVVHIGVARRLSSARGQCVREVVVGAAADRLDHLIRHTVVERLALHCDRPPYCAVVCGAGAWWLDLVCEVILRNRVERKRRPHERSPSWIA